MAKRFGAGPVMALHARYMHVVAHALRRALAFEQGQKQRNGQQREARGDHPEQAPRCNAQERDKGERQHRFGQRETQRRDRQCGAAMGHEPSPHCDVGHLSAHALAGESKQEDYRQ